MAAREAQRVWRLLRCCVPQQAARRPPICVRSSLQFPPAFCAPAAPIPRFVRRATTGSSPQHPSAPAYRPDNPGQSPPAQRYERPSYELTFTCKPCGVRSTHVVSKQAYHHGTTLVRCPGCKDRHVITDHLKIFNEKPMSFEDILAGKGVEIKKAFRTDEDTIEFIDD